MKRAAHLAALEKKPDSKTDLFYKAATGAAERLGAELHSAKSASHGKVGAGFDVLVLKFLWGVGVAVEEVFSFQAAVKFWLKRIAVGQHHHLYALLGGYALDGGHIIKAVFFGIILAHDQFTRYQLHQTNIVSHALLLNVSGL